MINFTIWNMRGLWARGKISHLQKLIKDYRLDLIVILEAKNCEDKIANLASKINMDSYHCSNACNKIRFLWTKEVTCTEFEYHS